VDAGDVVSIHDVLNGTAEPGRRVLVLDDLDDWRGLGTALHLAERDHEVTLITAAPVVARGLFHSAVDGPLRKRYALAGGRWITSATILGWRDGVASIRSTLTDEQTKVEADTLVLAETPVSVVGLAEDLRAQGTVVHAIGDCVAPRRASLAFLEGRELALRL
jgi:NADPH-dependent 2,4-dienoyl-CoA reductase/sulfur reductase-like enzyme